MVLLAVRITHDDVNTGYRRVMDQEVSIVDYGVGNLGSIGNMLKKLGRRSKLVSSEIEIANSTCLILPGIGAFDRGMEALQANRLQESVLLAANAGVPILGICLGMQLLGSGSEEGKLQGLNLIPGKCVRFTPNSKIKVPHMGWNEVSWQRSTLISEWLDNSRFYFTHSFHFVCDDPMHLKGTTFHGESVAAVIQKDNVVGAQFHPEKSHRFGMQLLCNFLEMSPC